MDKWLETARKHIEQGEALIQMGEELITSSVAALLRDWQTPSIVIDKLFTGAERWQAAIRQMQAPINVADILRSRTAESPPLAK
jgi:2-succinyl-5-enolpyruvyl-6-hydroxy-3-cyclohexene-1-carboxylate synthase